MNEDRFETDLAKLRPAAPSMVAQERARVAIASAQARSRRKFPLLALAALLLIAMVLGKLLTPARTVNRVVITDAAATKPLRDSTPAPTLAAYQSSAVFDQDKLDALLMRQSACVPAPPLAQSQRGCSSKTMLAAARWSCCAVRLSY